MSLDPVLDSDDASLGGTTTPLYKCVTEDGLVSQENVGNACLAAPTSLIRFIFKHHRLSNSLALVHTAPWMLMLS